MQIAGVDEAGRGPIIGPLVVAGVLLDEKDLPKLMYLGVKDSKRLLPRRREELAAEIKELALKYHVAMLSPAEIDRVVETGKKLHKLNRLEAQTMAKVIKILKPDVAYVDASDVLADRFKQHIAENLTFKVQIISEHKADVKYPIVSAASIIAKVERDRALSALQEKYGNMGCGYATDHNTIKFLEKWIRTFGFYPDFVRKSWKPAKRLKREAEAEQTKLG
ncbi:MAG: ribonuclease HII [Candidatus Bathyarchaeota archaeon]|nr:ribonuclease HII [Candidatus Bathyarchaeota archaeon]MDH4291669.1 ribonuclease HII [Dehalococcoidia bacterium]MDH5419086.1 ribonuclease HII [Candidatus Bathyarchaeota archaeon]MDH5701466.1 ribonuclease HII [Candidatus Bathyarchaeota archaeon]